MHGNVGKWVWDYYGAYDTGEQSDPTGAEAGTLRVYWGGGWNDFAKNMRSAYRAALDQNKGSFNIGIRLVRNAADGNGSIQSAGVRGADDSIQSAGDRSADGAGSKVLIAFFSWGGNTKGIAEKIQEYDFAGKTIIPFCSHGGGRFGQSLTAIAKLTADAVMGEALSVHYSGGPSLDVEIKEWLEGNGITVQ